jgi:outer membrane murein-binding lipoprotein Lpp
VLDRGEKLPTMSRTSCQSCAKVIKEADESITCDVCEQCYHKSCVTNGASNLCDLCEMGDMPSGMPKWFQPFATILIKVAKKTAVISSDTPDLIAKIDQMVTTITGLNAQLDVVQQENAQLRRDVIALQQQSRKDNVEISGVMARKGEDPNEIVLKIAGKVGAEIKRNDISIAHRVKKMKPDNKPDNIVVRFRDRRSKHLLLGAMRTYVRALGDDEYFVASEVDPSFGNNTLYVQDHLCPAVKLLHKECRDFRKAHKIKYLWTNDGTILMRKADGAHVIAIHQKADLLKLLR